MRFSLLLLACIPYVCVATTSTSDKNVDFSSRCFAPYTKAAMPDQERLDNASFALPLNTYFALGDPTVEGDEKCGNIAPTLSLDATTDANGCDIDTSDESNPEIDCTLTDTTLNGVTTTVTGDNSVGSEVTRTFDWTVTASGSGESEDFIGIPIAETGNTCDWFFDSSASAGGDGTDDTQAYDSLADWDNGDASAGDVLCWKLGSTFEDETLTVSYASLVTDWGGIRCYKMDGATPVKCEGAGKYGALIVGDNGTDYSTYPEINGTFESSCAYAGTCAQDTGSAVPSTVLRGLVHIAAGANHFFVERIKFRDSAGTSVSVARTEFAGYGGNEGVALRYNDMTRMAHSITFIDTGSELVYYGYNYGVENAIDNVVAGYTYHGTPHPQGYDATRARWVLMEHNYNARYGGELADCLRGDGFVMRHMVGGQNRSSGLYCDNARRVLLENARTWGGNNVDTTPVRWGPDTRGGGTGFAREWYGGCFGGNQPQGDWDSYPLITRNNRMANGAGVLISAPDLHWTDCGNQWSGAVYNNTVMFPPASGASVNSFSFSFGALVAPNPIKNNIFVSDGDPCSLGSSTGAWDTANNFWSSDPASANCDDAGDDYGDPELMGSGWSTKYTDLPPTDTDFTPQVGSPVIDAAVGETTVTSASGTGSSFVVDYVGYYTDGWTCTINVSDASCDLLSPSYLTGTAYEGHGRVVEGDIIQVGNDTNLRVLFINYATNTIVVDQSITWTQGDDVCWQSCTKNQGSDPDYF